jgi:hypothetical protein
VRAGEFFKHVGNQSDKLDPGFEPSPTNLLFESDSLGSLADN